MNIDNYKTSCCKAGWYRKGRANLRCNNCDEDVTMEIVLLVEALGDKIKPEEKS